MKNKQVRKMVADCAIGTDILEIASDNTVANGTNWPEFNGRKASAKKIKQWVEWVRKHIDVVCDEFPFDSKETAETYICINPAIDAFEMLIFNNIHKLCKLSIERKGTLEVLVGTNFEIHLFAKLMKKFFKLNIEGGSRIDSLVPSKKVTLLGAKYASIYNTLSRNGWQIKEGAYTMGDVLYLKGLLDAMAPSRKVDIITLKDKSKFLDVPAEVINMLN